MNNVQCPKSKVQRPKMQEIWERLEREIAGFLCDMELLERRTDGFVDQDDMVQRFVEEWNVIVSEIEMNVMKQLEKGKTKVKI